MSVTHSRPGELIPARIERLPDGRWRCTRFIAIGHGLWVVAGRIVKTGDPDPNLAANTRQE
ncbi:MAG: hypothetical protein LBK99_05760, partial [Opitutaceae bacterium]|nr:hypothetical protein [Opitutaceae bacterium]